MREPVMAKGTDDVPEGYQGVQLLVDHGVLPLVDGWGIPGEYPSSRSCRYLDFTGIVIYEVGETDVRGDITPVINWLWNINLAP